MGRIVRLVPNVHEKELTMQTLYPKLITDALATVNYAGTKKNLIESEMLVDDVRIDGMKVSFTLLFPKETDPFLKSTVKAAEAAIQLLRGQGSGGHHKDRVQDKAASEGGQVPHRPEDNRRKLRKGWRRQIHGIGKHRCCHGTPRL